MDHETLKKWFEDRLWDIRQIWDDHRPIPQYVLGALTVLIIVLAGWHFYAENQLAVMREEQKVWNITTLPNYQAEFIRAQKALTAKMGRYSAKYTADTRTQMDRSQAILFGSSSKKADLNVALADWNDALNKEKSFRLAIQKKNDVLDLEKQLAIIQWMNAPPDDEDSKVTWVEQTAEWDEQISAIDSGLISSVRKQLDDAETYLPDGILVTCNGSPVTFRNQLGDISVARKNLIAAEGVQAATIGGEMEWDKIQAYSLAKAVETTAITAKAAKATFSQDLTDAKQAIQKAQADQIISLTATYYQDEVNAFILSGTSNLNSARAACNDERPAAAEALAKAASSDFASAVLWSTARPTATPEPTSTPRPVPTSEPISISVSSDNDDSDSSSDSWSSDDSDSSSDSWGSDDSDSSGDW